MKVVILAAGKSTRMKSRTPKVLHKLAGVPILRWVIDQAISLEPEEIIVVIGHEGDRVREAFKDIPKITFVNARAATRYGPRGAASREVA